jgi:putative FmdB family regulatory protein
VCPTGHDTRKELCAVPTYEYACTKCGEHLEVVQSFRDDSLTECPNCGGALRKVFGSIGVVFKGSGFYKTDSRPAAKSSSGSKGDAASSTSGSSTDSSPAASSSDSGSKAKDGGSGEKPTKPASPAKTGKAGSGTSGSSGAAAAAS